MPERALAAQEQGDRDEACLRVEAIRLLNYGRSVPRPQKIEAAKLDIDFGSQIRNYVLAPYRLVKDLRSQMEMGDVDRVLDGDLDRFMHAYLVYAKTGRTANDETAVRA